LEWLTKARDIREAFNLAIAEYTEDRTAAEALLKSAEIRFANGSRIIAIPANPNTARGYSANIVLDEFAYHENPDAIWAAMFPSLTNPLAGTFMDRVRAAIGGGDTSAIKRQMRLLVVSTFNGRNNKFYNLWESAAKNGFSKHLVTIHDAVREGLPVDIEQLRAGCDDPDIWAQEFECVPNDVSTVLLPYELIAACESDKAAISVAPEYWTTTAARVVLGIDFGRKRDLTVCWADEVIGNLALTREVLELSNMPTPQQVEILSPRIKRAERVCLDYTGPGVGLGDYLVKEFGEWKPEEHRYGKIELITMGNANKVDMCSKLRMSFENRREQIPANRTIREDLHSVYRVTTPTGAITYRAPHNEDGHADRFTAKMLATRAREIQGVTLYAEVC
jgi:phage FluMu gp28-like protein